MYEIQNPETGSVSLTDRKLVRDSVLNQSWHVWFKEYIRNLPPAKGSVKVCEIKQGDLVLIREDNTPRLTWPVGVIIEAIPSGDNIIRSCRVKVRNFDLIRPVQRLHRL